MNRLTYLVAFLAILYGVYSAFTGEPDAPRRPPPKFNIPDKPKFKVAPQPRQAAPRGPTIEVDVGAKGNSTGTAFAITDNGWWLTARHVAHGCDALWVLTAPRRGFKAMEVHLHPNADLALLRTRAGMQPLNFAPIAPMRGQEGFSLGYPQGQPGDVHARMLGQARLKAVGRYRTNEPIIAWAELSRRPSNLPQLGGLSGGPMLDDQGQVVGVLVASSKRRGRVMTTAQRSIHELLAQIPEARAPQNAPKHQINSGNFTAQGKALRRNLTIAKVVCRVGQGRRRPR